MDNFTNFLRDKRQKKQKTYSGLEEIRQERSYSLPCRQSKYSELHRPYKNTQIIQVPLPEVTVAVLVKALGCGTAHTHFTGVLSLLLWTSLLCVVVLCSENITLKCQHAMQRALARQQLPISISIIPAVVVSIFQKILWVRRNKFSAHLSEVRHAAFYVHEWKLQAILQNFGPKQTVKQRKSTARGWLSALCHKVQSPGEQLPSTESRVLIHYTFLYCLSLCNKNSSLCK